MTDDSRTSVEAASPHRLVVRVDNAQGGRLHLAALARTFEALAHAGIVEFSEEGEGFRLDINPNLVSESGLRRIIEGAERSRPVPRGPRPRTRHLLPARFGGPAGPDLGVAAILAGTSEKMLVRRLTRVAHPVRALTVPPALLLLGVSWARAATPQPSPVEQRGPSTPGP